MQESTFYDAWQNIIEDPELQYGDLGVLADQAEEGNEFPFFKQVFHDFMQDWDKSPLNLFHEMNKELSNSLNQTNNSNYWIWGMNIANKLNSTYSDLRKLINIQNPEDVNKIPEGWRRLLDLLDQELLGYNFPATEIIKKYYNLIR